MGGAVNLDDHWLETSIADLLLGAVGYMSAGEQRAEPLFALTISYSLIPCALVLVAALMAWRYSLTADRHSAIRAKIDARIAAETATETRPDAAVDATPLRP